LSKSTQANSVSLELLDYAVKVENFHENEFIKELYFVDHHQIQKMLVGCYQPLEEITIDVKFARIVQEEPKMTLKQLKCQICDGLVRLPGVKCSCCLMGFC
tara:strand:- start:1082 stop:1384 length:303 start_codon:yes stop_codon:yes gene_type:complete